MRGHSGERFDRLGPAPQSRGLLWIVLGWLSFAGLPGHAGPLVTADSPIGFFTNVAARLLQSQLGLSLNHLQLYPTNQYTPSVHRLLQVTANLYDATTNRALTGLPRSALGLSAGVCQSDAQPRRQPDLHLAASRRSPTPACCPSRWWT